jgi:hypothetical protein
MLDKHCQRSPQTGQPGSNQTSQSIFVSSHFHSKKLPVTLCYGAFWNENAYFVYANSVAGSIRPFVAGFQVTGDINTNAVEQLRPNEPNIGYPKLFMGGQASGANLSRPTTKVDRKPFPRRLDI